MKEQLINDCIAIMKQINKATGREEFDIEQYKKMYEHSDIEEIKLFKSNLEKIEV